MNKITRFPKLSFDRGFDKRQIRALSAILALLLILSSVLIPASALFGGSPAIEDTISSKAPEDAQSAHREEVIYATLDGSGKQTAAYAVVLLDVKNDGVITDYGEYSSVKNLTDTAEISLNGDTVSAAASRGNFYYQGNLLNARLPWDIEIGYELDGKPISPTELAGASGKLSAVIKTKQNPDSKAIFYENYMLQISVTLSMANCRSISAPGASIANAGGNKQLNFTVMPNTESKNTFSAEVTDFAMDGVTIAAIPFSMEFDVPDMSDMTGGLTQLSSAISQINSGMSALSGGASELSGGAAELSSGSAQFAEGLSLLGSNADTLLSASSQINDALSQAAGAFSGKLEIGLADVFGLAEIMFMPATLTGYANTISSIASKGEELVAAYGALSEKLSALAQTLPNGAVDPADISRLRELCGGDAALEQLITGYNAALSARTELEPLCSELQSAAKALASQQRCLKDAASSLQTTACSLTKVFTSSNLLGSFDQLKSGMSQLAESYSQFHSGLGEYFGGVKTAAASYIQLNEGISQLSGGASELSVGIGKLAKGISQLNSQTKSIPQKLNASIEELLQSYDYSDFECTSFISDKNDYADAVQFVLVTDKIALPTADAEPSEPTENVNFWDRLTELFKSK